MENLAKVIFLSGGLFLTYKLKFLVAKVEVGEHGWLQFADVDVGRSELCLL